MSYQKQGRYFLSALETSRNKLACAYQAAGDLGRAIPLYEVTFADCERVLGPEHPTTNHVRSSLASLID